MTDPPGPEHLLAEIANLRQQLRALENERAAFLLHKQLLRNLATLSWGQEGGMSGNGSNSPGQLLKSLLRIIQSSTDEPLFHAALQTILDASVELAQAQKGSLLLLDEQRRVTHSILTREETDPDRRKSLINKVLDQGLAGWVCRHRQVGLVLDTETDERWLTFPDQPYVVRSALATPILKGSELLAVITLLHSQPYHFSEDIADLMQITANQIALTLESVALKLSLQRERSALDIQRQLLENLVESSDHRQEKEILADTLQKVVDLAADLTKAETSSLFLLSPEGKIADAILSRREVTPKQRSALIGKVLDQGLAGWVNQHRRLGLIMDTETDERWLTLPNQPYTVRSALGIPILRGERLLGILTLLHPQAGHFSLEVADQMKIVADHIALVLENARLYSKLDQYTKTLDLELQKGRAIQIDFLPYQICQPPQWEIAASFYPAKQVAGDFYDVFDLGDQKHVGLVIADVCDKGVGAALFMALFRSLIRIFAQQPNDWGQDEETMLTLEKPQPEGWISTSNAVNLTHLRALRAMKLTNDYIVKYHWNLSMFATLFFGVLETETGLLSYVNGGHEPLFILNQSAVKTVLNPTSPALGMMPDSEFKIQQVFLDPGDILLGYTDGVTEGKNEEGEQFKAQRLLSLLTPCGNSASQLLERIKGELFAFIGETPQFDDITMLALRRLTDIR
ncbi:MAG: GAF domain-containing SpoIIE family protein phosphatase [Cyanobacteriota bacterium]